MEQSKLLRALFAYYGSENECGRECYILKLLAFRYHHVFVIRLTGRQALVKTFLP